jgi:CRP-like cAMP-binding protein
MVQDNHLLASLAPATIEALRPSLETVELPKGLTLFEAAQSVKYAVFPTSGLVSLLGSTAEGGSVELSSVSNEGLVGLPVILSGELSRYAARVQVAGSGLRLPTRILEAELKHRPDFQRALLHWSCHLLTDIAQAVVCHRFHRTLERLCRWLITTSDRLHTDLFRLTHEELGNLLGVPRTGITNAALALQDAGAIHCRHGRITLLNRRRLELSACECYQRPDEVKCVQLNERGRSG